MATRRRKLCGSLEESNGLLKDGTGILMPDCDRVAVCDQSFVARWMSTYHLIFDRAYIIGLIDINVGAMQSRTHAAARRSSLIYNDTRD
jgi:hypothetical protein